MRCKGRGNKENLVKSLLRNISESFSGENRRAFQGKERLSDDPEINNIQKPFPSILMQAIL